MIEKETKSKAILAGFKDLIDGALLGVIIALLLNCVIANSVVPSGSMENTIPTGSYVVGSKIAYKFAEPKRGDIVIFKYPDDRSIYFVKRLIGLPGDTIEFISNANNSSYDILINGELYKEDYLANNDPTMSYGRSSTYTVPSNCYFFLGDNRNQSNDARFWKTQYVPREDLVAKVYFKYWKGFEWLDK